MDLLETPAWIPCYRGGPRLIAAGQKLPRFFRLFRLFRLFLVQNFEDVFVGFLLHFSLENAPQIQFKLAFFSTFWHVLFRGGSGNAQNVKISVLPTPYAHFRRFKGSRIHSKNGSKITKDLEKKHAWKCYVFCIRFFAFFSRFCLNFGSFWSSKGHLGAFKIKSFSNMAPRWSLRGLRGPSGIDFGVQDGL